MPGTSTVHDRDDDHDRTLLERYRRDGDRAARNELIERHRPLARSLARRYARRGEPLDDLEQVALIGLLKAAERFDPTQGVAFAGFASITANGELKRHLRDTTWRVRVPRRAQERSLELGRAIETLGHRLHRAPTVDEIAAELGCTPDDVLEALEVGASYRNVTADHGAGDYATGTIARRTATIDAGYTALEDADLVKQLLHVLPPRERRVCELRYYDDLTQSQIAELVGVSQMQISRLLRASLERMRTHACAAGAA